MIGDPNTYRVAAARRHQDQRLVMGRNTYGDARNGDVATRSPERDESSIHAKEHSRRQYVRADYSEGIGRGKFQRQAK
jgi:hypothetical protein